ncbi:MAG TPA: 8-amino-7-oxononanoate synthase [Desulfatiglandales bacterium]|nr:8-amino-7-oxononanoate synthase [Desulfatiglandales bacterium]
MKKDMFIEDRLGGRLSQNLYRRLKTVRPLSGVDVEVEGRRMLNFCSNDYLGLSRHPLLEERAIEYLQRYGSGSTASRLVCGNYDCFEKVEKRIAGLTEYESALIFNSGFQANVSLLPSLADRNTLILSDRLNHNSIIQGALLSRCRIKSFRHNDMNHLEGLLRENRDNGDSRILVVTESVFSMDGDQSDIDTLVRLNEEYGTFLIVDEAHGTGVLGKKGMGLTSGKDVDIVMGTMGKACGSFGAYIASSAKMREYLINFCYGLIYSTALPPSVIGSMDAALELIPAMDKERHDLLSKAAVFRSSLNELGYDTGKSTTQIIPVIIGDEGDALDLSKWLEDNNILTMTFRYPTVAKGESRIRLSLSAAHTQEHLERVVDLFKRWRDKTH